MRLRSSVGTHIFWWLSLGIFPIVAALIFYGFMLRSSWRAQKLRDEICQLEVGKSTFADVSAVFRRYDGYILHSAGTPAECSPDDCLYVLYVANPMPVGIRVWPKMGLVASLQVSENVLKARYVAITRLKPNQALEVFVQQSSEARFPEEVRILRRGMIPRIGAQVSAEASVRFVQLVGTLNVKCLAHMNGCSQLSEMLPYLGDVGEDRVIRPLSQR